MTRNPRIAFCTTCKGRAQHVRQTLARNMADNRSYLNCFFVILDYGSEDGLREYVEEFPELISSGRIVYYRLENAGSFKMAHAKNTAQRIAIEYGADILVNLDADNFTNAGFAEYIARMYATHGEDIFLWAKMNKGVLPRGISGRIVTTKNQFIAVGGYDERYEVWSRDDKDFNERLRRVGFRAFEIDQRYLGGVPHNDRMRFREYPHARSGLDSSANDCPPEDLDNTVVNFGKIGCAELRGMDDVRLTLAPIPTRLFGIGMHKTGTTSLYHAFKELGFDAAHWQTAHWAKTVWTEMRTFGKSVTLERYYGITDLPLTLLYRELDKAYPGSKFILTLRPEDEWLASVEKHWSRTGNKWRTAWDTDPFTHKVHRELYGRKSFDRDIFLERYRRHNAEVLEYFKDRPADLLVMHEPRWEMLCTFLELPTPTAAYPHANMAPR